MFKDRRLWIIAVLVTAVATSFWSSSRYPSLDSKSSMSGAVALQDALSFEAVFNTSTAPDLLTKIAYTFGNWVYINWQGMGFGLVLAILFLTALPLLRESYSRTRLGSTVLGSMIGIPLGLCVNCSAPMAYGIYRGGGRPETALAAMLSSPALNVIVIGMSIALLPFYLWATKLILSLLLIFVFVPVLVRLTSEGLTAAPSIQQTENNIEPCLSVIDATSWLIPAISKNALGMLWKMVPLMLLAGLLGAVMVTILPWDKLIDLLPMHNIPLIITAMLLLAAFTLVLPVPVAFDIILIATLVSAGLPDRYAGVMLFALGSFSIYSFMVLNKAQLKSVAIKLTFCIWLLSIMAGAISHYWGLYDAKQQKELWFEVVKDSEGVKYQPPQLQHVDLSDLKATPELVTRTVPKLSGVTETTLSSQTVIGTSWRMQLEDIGFQNDTPPVFWSNLAPYSAFASLAATDINQDGWPDLIKGGYSGVQIYINTGGRFQLIETPALDHFKQVSALAPADLDNNGTNDLVIALFSGEKYIAYNSKEVPGSFNSTIKIADSSDSYSPAIAIADLDQNGELDILFGNQTVLDLLNITTKESLNTFYMQHDSEFTQVDLPRDLGATLSVLISDIDSNQNPDVFVGNDFDSPDHYYQYDKIDARLEPWLTTDILETTRTTMSIDTADIDNDLEFESYIAQVSMESPNTEYLDVKRQASVYERNYGRLLYGFPNPFGELDHKKLETCEISNTACVARNARTQISAAVRARDLSKCSSLPANQIWQCAAVAVHEFAYRRGRFSDLDIPCENLGEGYPEISVICKRMSEKNKLRATSDLSHQSLTDDFPQNSLTNILLKTPETGTNSKHRYKDVAEDMGVQYSGWTWNAKFADLDGDQWQDLFIANGWYQMRSDTSNVFYRNLNGGKFVNQTKETGLIDYDPTKSYVYIDFDLDGDLDIVTHNIYGELNAYSNQNTNNHIQFEIEDSIGNRSGVGAKIIIEYGDNQELRQIRELKLSGGYQSFDPLIAHFGLGSHMSISKVSIQFLDGREYVYEADFKSGHHYQIQIR